MESLAHEIFLLMLNLSQVSTEARIVSLFLESMNAMIPGLRFRLLEEGEQAAGEVMGINTAAMSFGRIALEGAFDGLPRSSRALIRNAVAMLAVMLERSRHIQLLEDANLKALRESEASLADAQRIGGIGNWAWDMRTGAVTQSEQAAINLGLPKLRRCPSPDVFLERIHPDDLGPLHHQVTESLRQGQTLECSFRVLWPDGQQRVLAVRGEFVRDSSGAPVRVTGISQDITERKRLEEQLLQAQRLESVGRMAGGLAHDFNNLLTVINGYGDLSLSALGATHPLRRCLEEMRKAGERAADLTRQLLAFSRKQVLEPRVLDLNESVRSVENLLRRLIEEDIELRLALAPSLLPVKADPTKIEQVLMNLVVNARDAMPEGGVLTIETAMAEFPGGSAPEICVMLAVTDTGVGMDADTRLHIFEPFFTTKEEGKGTGLGLSTVYGIVTQSGGRIHVESAPGAGSTFRVLLPAVGEAAAGAGGERASNELQRGSEAVLLVEDEESVRHLVREMLTTLGYTTFSAARGEEALQLHREHGGAIRILLTDVVMPGMSGGELAEQLCRARPDLTVVYMSGYADDAILQRGLPSSSAALLQKPFTLAELGRQLRMALNPASGGRLF